MNVLIGCETSGRVRDAFASRGHYAVSCDTLPSEVGGSHIRGDILNQLQGDWDLFIAFPPCFRLSKASGAHWKKDWFKKEQLEAVEFVRKLMNAPINKIAIENPVGFLSTAIRKPDQIIHPYYFGDPWMKETCLWLKNLPLLRYNLEDDLFSQKTAVEPKGNWVKPGNNRPHRKFNDVKEGGKGNWKDRSRTFLSIANAMAEQWG